MSYYKKPNFVDWEMSAEEQQIAAQQEEMKAEKAFQKLNKLIDKAESLIGRAEFHEMVSAFIYWNRYVADYKNPVEYPKYKLPENYAASHVYNLRGGSKKPYVAISKNGGNRHFATPLEAFAWAVSLGVN